MVEESSAVMFLFLFWLDPFAYENQHPIVPAKKEGEERWRRKRAFLGCGSQFCLVNLEMLSSFALFIRD